MILAFGIGVVIGLLICLSALIFWGWRTSKVTLHGAQEDMLRGFTKDWKR